MRRRVAFLLFLVSCGGGGGGGVPGTRITSVTPGPDSSSGEPPTKITVKFDRPVTEDSFNEETIFLSWSGGDGIFGNGNDVTLFTAAISFPNSTTAVLDLAGIPLTDEFFRLTLLGTGDRKILAEDGLALDGEFAGTFPSGNSAEGGDFEMFFRGTTSVETMTPAPGATVMPPSMVVLGLASDVDPATIDATTFRVIRSGGDSNFNNGNEVGIDPTSVTRSGSSYRFGLPGGLAADLYQVTLAGAGSGQALRFDGLDDLVRVPPAIQFAPGSGSLSVECWVEIQDVAHADGILECADTDFGNGWRLRHLANGSFQFSVAGASATRTAAGGSATLGWHHVAGVLDAALGETRLYVDGTLAATDAGGAPGAVTPTAPLTFGKSGTTFLMGLMDDVRVWQSARTEADVRRDMFRQLTGGEALLRAYWRMDTDILQLVIDTTTGQHTGTLGVDQNVAADDPSHVPSHARPRVLDLDGDPIDGTFAGTLPGGIGKPGVDFVATFRVQ